MPIYKCIITSHGQKWYYKDGKRIPNAEGEKLGIECKPVRKKTSAKRKSPKKSPKKKTTNKYRGYGFRNGCKDDADCKDSDKICNIDSGRCVNRHGRIGEKILALRMKENERRKSSSKKSIEKSPVRSGNCIERSKLPLRPHQIKVVRYMQNHRGLLVVHGTGKGKTLTAVTSSQCYLDENPDKRVVLIAPASLIANFSKELVKYGVKNKDKYDMYTFDKFMNMYKTGRAPDCTDKMLIVDEVHNLRTNVQFTQDDFGKKIISKGKKTYAAMKCAYKADKVLLLTATPFVNQVKDFIPIINMIYGRDIVGSRGDVNAGRAKDLLDNKDFSTLYYYLKDKVDVDNIKDLTYFPERKDHIMNVEMDEKTYNNYIRNVVYGEKLFGIDWGENPKSFYHAYRRGVNKVGPEYYTEKIKAAIPILKSGKALIYSNWVQFGVNVLEKALADNKITYSIITGATKKIDRARIVNAFNSDKFKVLLITKAAGEGLDLKGVRSVVILEPTWNDAGIQQIIGRAIRYKSHTHLPPDQRKVDIYMMSLIEPKAHLIKGKDGRYYSQSGDYIVYGIIEKKRKMSEEIMGKLMKMSI